MSQEPLTHRTEAGIHYLEGVLDETAPPVLAKVVAQTPPKASVQLDVGGVKRINSLGVRAWVDFIRSLGNRDIGFRRCSPAFVDQLNTVSDFRAGARIISFLAPYVCEKTGTVFYEEFTVGKDISHGKYEALDGRRCAECPDPLVFDDIPERYLQFLSFS